MKTVQAEFRYWKGPIDEARLSPEWVLEGLTRFAANRPKCLGVLRSQLEGLA